MSTDTPRALGLNSTDDSTMETLLWRWVAAQGAIPVSPLTLTAHFASFRRTGVQTASHRVLERRKQQAALGTQSGPAGVPH